MKAIFIGTGKEPFVIEFDYKLQNFESLVGGSFDALPIKAENCRSINLIYNKGYENIHKEINKCIIFPYVDKCFLTGNIICVACDETKEELVSLTDDEVKFYLKELAKDEVIVTY